MPEQFNRGPVTPEQIRKTPEHFDTTLNNGETDVSQTTEQLRNDVDHREHNEEFLAGLRQDIATILTENSTEAPPSTEPRSIPIFASLEDAGLAETYEKLKSSASERHNRQLGEPGKEVTAYGIDDLVLRIPNEYNHENSNRAAKSTQKRAEALRRGEDIDGLEQLRVHDADRNIIATERIDGKELHKLTPKDVTAFVENDGLVKLWDAYSVMNERGIVADEVPDNFLLNKQGAHIIDYKTTSRTIAPEDQMLTFADKTLYYAIREQKPSERDAWRNAADEALRLAKPQKIRSVRTAVQSIKHLKTRRKLNKLFK